VSALLRLGKEFFSAPASPAPLRALRVSISGVLLVQALLLSGAVVPFFSRHGILQTALTDLFIADGAMPRLYQLTDALTRAFGWTEATGITACSLAYVACLALLFVGRAVRPAALLACFLHATFLTTGYYAAYGVDRFTQVCLFYFLFMPVTERAPSASARLSLRVLQLHLCVAYVASGLEKIVGVQWRDGEAVFRAVMLPSFRQLNVEWMAFHPLLGLALCWGTLALEIGYGIFIWPRATRRWWILGIEGLHLGIAVFMGLYFFAATMGLLTFCCFGIPLLEARQSERLAAGLASRPLDN
jgi:hypothetical protein